MNWFIVVAIISPFVWGLMNILDKYVVSHKVKNPLSFAVVAGMVNLAFGIIVSFFADWSTIGIKDIFYPALAGALFGGQFFLYYWMISKEDVSNIIGFVYFYPVVVAFLSFLILHETLSLLSYVGVCVIILGILLLSIRMRKLDFKVAIWMVIVMILVAASYEFLIKMSTTVISEVQGLAISLLSVGSVIMLGWLHPGIRKGVRHEFKNLKWAVLVESMTFLAVLTAYFGMAGMSATIFSSIAATQPVAVLLFEKLFHILGINVCRDESFLPKLVPIGIIVVGVILLYIS